MSVVKMELLMVISHIKKQAGLFRTLSAMFGEIKSWVKNFRVKL